jgi:hypothetical protein
VELTHVTFRGPAIDDPEVLAAAPAQLRDLLGQVNGFIQFGGGLHVRGACREPLWHSLRWAWRSEQAFHRRYPLVQESDVPFAQDCVGDQWLLRDHRVVRLCGETGELKALDLSLVEFLEAAQADPVEFLGLHPLVQFNNDGGILRPGELLSVAPPFCTQEAAKGVSLRALDALDRLGFLAEFSRQIASVPDGAQIKIEFAE